MKTKENDPGKAQRNTRESPAKPNKSPAKPGKPELAWIVILTANRIDRAGSCAVTPASGAPNPAPGVVPLPYVPLNQQIRMVQQIEHLDMRLNTQMFIKYGTAPVLALKIRAP